MTELCTEVGYLSLIKQGEMLCGDHIEVVPHGENSTVVVLADGLGNGVKANILSTLTSKIISTMMANDMTVEDCVKTIAETLPICKVRKLAYSTFTIIHITNNQEAEIIQYDNPKVVMLRGGQLWEYPMTIEVIDNKRIYKSRVALQEDDLFVTFSDGVIHAGVGGRRSFGWQWEEVAGFIEQNAGGLSAKAMSTLLTDQCRAYYDGKPGDDTSVCTVRIRGKRTANVMIGPPANPADDEKVMAAFLEQEGCHIVSGGTTSTIVADFLQTPLHVPIDGYVDPEIPPVAHIEGIDLATEGIITINRVLEYARDFLGENSRYSQWKESRDGAALVSKLLFEEATHVNFFVGMAVNPAHQNPGLPIGFNIKMRLVEDLSQCLRTMGKKISVRYF